MSDLSSHEVVRETVSYLGSAWGRFKDVKRGNQTLEGDEMEAPETNSKTEEPEKKYTVSGPSEACMCEGEYDEGCVDMLSTFVEKIESNLRHMCSESNAYDVIFLSARQFEVTMDVLSICDIEGCREEDVMDVFWQEHLNIIRLYKSAG